MCACMCVRVCVCVCVCVRVCVCVIVYKALRCQVFGVESRCQVLTLFLHFFARMPGFNGDGCNTSNWKYDYKGGGGDPKKLYGQTQNEK